MGLKQPIAKLNEAQPETYTPYVGCCILKKITERPIARNSAVKRDESKQYLECAHQENKYNPTQLVPTRDHSFDATENNIPNSSISEIHNNSRFTQGPKKKFKIETTLPS